MTREQIKILIEHGDIIPGTGSGVLFFQNEQIEFFGLSNEFHKALTQIFEQYLRININGDCFLSGISEIFKERIETSIEENLNTKAQKTAYLNIKILEEMQALDKLRKDFMPWEQSLKDINERWLYKLNGTQKENLIECFKFKVLSGKKIESFPFSFQGQFPNFCLLDEYFSSNEMHKIYTEAAIEENIKWLQKRIDELEHDKSFNHVRSNASAKQPKPEIKPIFKEEVIENILEILKDYFPGKKNELTRVLKTGNVPMEKLLFYGNGKTLIDFFKQLIRGQFLIITIQKDFEKWICESFEYIFRGNRKSFKSYSSHQIISGNNRAAKGNRLIDVENVNGKFQISRMELKNRK